jgi:hypothetical protein
MLLVMLVLLVVALLVTMVHHRPESPWRLTAR